MMRGPACLGRCRRQQCRVARTGLAWLALLLLLGLGSAKAERPLDESWPLSSAASSGPTEHVRSVGQMFAKYLLLIYFFLDKKNYSTILLFGIDCHPKTNCQSLTVWPEPTWIKKSWLLLPQHQSTYPRGPESASIEIPPFRPKFT